MIKTRSHKKYLLGFFVVVGVIIFGWSIPHVFALTGQSGSCTDTSQCSAGLSCQILGADPFGGPYDSSSECCPSTVSVGHNCASIYPRPGGFTCAAGIVQCDGTCVDIIPEQGGGTCTPTCGSTAGACNVQQTNNGTATYTAITSSTSNGVTWNCAVDSTSVACGLCNSGYTWNGTVCVSTAVQPVCGSVPSPFPTSAPSSACSAGTAANYAETAGVGATWNCTDPTNTYPNQFCHSCNTGYGWSNGSCQLTQAGSCGSGAGYANGKTYPNGSSSYGSDSQCQIGNPTTTNFPTSGNSVTWTCSGQGGGGNSSSCSASQAGAVVASPPLGDIEYPAAVNFNSGPDYANTWPQDNNGNPDVSGSAVNIVGWAVDGNNTPEVSISSVTIYIDGTQVGPNVAHTLSWPAVCGAGYYPGRPDCNNVGFSYTWNSTSVANGSHIIMVKVADSNGAWTGSQSITVTNCTTPTYHGGGFSAYSTNTGPTGSTLSITPGSKFYAYVDYGAQGLPTNVNNPITPPSNSTYTCSWGPGTNSGWVAGSSGNSMARFDCATNNPSVGGNYNYQTGIDAIYDYDNNGHVDDNDLTYLLLVQTGAPGYSCPVGKDCDVYNDGVSDSPTVVDWSNYSNMLKSFAFACPVSGQNVGTLTVVVPPTASLTVNTAYGSASNGASIYTFGYNSGDTPTLTWSSTNATSCTVTSNNGDNLSGTSGNAVPAKGLGADNGTGQTWTYTLNCSGPGGSASQTAIVKIPPAPSNPAATCVAPGTAATLTWTPPSGWNNFYVRNNNLTTGSTPNYWNENYAGSTYNVPDSYAGAEYPVNPVPGDSYSMWVNTRAPNGAGSQSEGVNYSCSAAVCPSSVTNTVTLSTYSIQVPNTTIASAPAGWSGGSFSSSNSGVASASGANNSIITGVSAGTVTVSGSGWTAPNGATSCNLGASANLTVTAPPGPPNGGGAITPTTTCSPSGISLSWSAGTGATYYNIFRSSNSATSSASVIASTTTLSFTDAVSGGPYYYWVQSANSSGTSVQVPASSNGTGVSPSCGPPPPGGGTPTNSNPPAACGQIQLNWTDNSPNETGFYIYMDGGSSPVATAPASSPASQTGETVSYIFTPPDNNPHTYQVAAFNGSGTSAKVSENGGSIVAGTCGPNLGNSNKEITAINNSSVFGSSGNTYQCEGQTNPLSSSTLINNGNTLTFAINICNNNPLNSNATATVTTVVDSMTNLQQPSGGWNAQYCLGNSSCSAIPNASIGVAGTAPNQTLTFTLNKQIPFGSTALPGVLSYNAVVATQSSATYGRLQNSAVINYGVGQSWPVNTPLILYYSGTQTPGRTEIPPGQ